MPSIKKILAATDLSDYSFHAATRAGALCADLKCEAVELLTVKEAGLPEALGLVLKASPAVAESMLAERTLRELRLISGQLQDNYGIHCTDTVKFGQPEEEIISRANELPAELTVIGMHGGNFFTDFFLGNTADKLARLSRTPLLVVKNQLAQPYRQVLVPVDFSENSRRAAQMALKVAPDAQITFLHAFDMVFEEQMRYVNVARDAIHEYHIKAEEDARRDLNQFIAELQPEKNEGDKRLFSRHVVFGHPGHVVHDHAKVMKPDLIVLGKHGGSRFEELLLGSVSRQVIGQSSCDVLIVPLPNRAG
jgi:nucleotide-binding universal stress UspA family protein